MSRMKTMVAIAALGLVVASGGFLYGGFTIGVPYQDATPAQAAAERANMAITSRAMVGGVLMFLAGIGGAAILGLRRLIGPGH